MRIDLFIRRWFIHDARHQELRIYFQNNKLRAFRIVSLNDAHKLLRKTAMNKTFALEARRAVKLAFKVLPNLSFNDVIDMHREDQSYSTLSSVSPCAGAVRPHNVLFPVTIAV